MSEQWSNCEVEFPIDHRAVPGCTVERTARKRLTIAIPGGVVKPVIDSVKGLPRWPRRPFTICVSCFGRQQETFEGCRLKDYERGRLPSDNVVHLGDLDTERPHVFTFRCA